MMWRVSSGGVGGHCSAAVRYLRREGRVQVLWGSRAAARPHRCHARIGLERQVQRRCALAIGDRGSGGVGIEQAAQHALRRGVLERHVQRQRTVRVNLGSGVGIQLKQKSNRRFRGARLECQMKQWLAVAIPCCRRLRVRVQELSKDGLWRCGGGETWGKRW